MRIVWAMIPLLAGCSELDPDFAVSQWYDGVEQVRPTGQGLHTATLESGEWVRSTDQAIEGDNAWKFGTGGSWPTLCDAALQTPALEAGRVSFLRFAWRSDIPVLNEERATDGAAVEYHVEGTADDEWFHLETHAGYPYILDQTTIGSPLSLGEGLLAGTDRSWHDDYVTLDEVEVGTMIRFRFHFGCDVDPANNTGEGLFIDDVEYLILE